ncbi:hypothetical protein COO60DRAFT_562161 [Scenedesmus sp. NREL 46B-D3]|nr:hypothetical protein COO60DRAFT_562161 [Scenedesmus sp. NREL 46B-D3]
MCRATGVRCRRCCRRPTLHAVQQRHPAQPPRQLLHVRGHAGGGGGRHQAQQDHPGDHDSARHAGPCSPWSKLYKYVVRAVKNNSKAAKKKGQTTQPQRPAVAAAARGASAPSTSAAAAEQQSAVNAAGGSGSSSKGGKCCWGCGAAGSGVSLRKCSSLSKAMYCSRNCQEEHWKEHKADCKKWKQEKQGAER